MRERKEVGWWAGRMGLLAEEKRREGRERCGLGWEERRKYFF